jgi:hypothetical protein
VTRPYAFHVEAYLAPLPDWRWRRAESLVVGDPHAGRYADEDATLRALRFLKGDPAPALVDVRDAAEVYRTGGLRRAVVEAYLLTDLNEQEIGERTGLSGAAVTAFAELFFTVRGDDPLSRFHRAEAVQPGDRLRTAAVQWGPQGVEAEAAWQAGGFGLSPELREAFERRDLLDRLHDANPKAFLRAVDRKRAIDAGLRPGVMHRSG